MQRLSGGCVWPALPSIVPYPVLPHEVEGGGWVISVNHNASQLFRHGCKAPDGCIFLSSPSYGEVAGSRNGAPSRQDPHVARAACGGSGLPATAAGPPRTDGFSGVPAAVSCETQRPICEAPAPHSPMVIALATDPRHRAWIYVSHLPFFMFTS